MTKFQKAHAVTGVLCQTHEGEIYLRLLSPSQKDATWCLFEENEDGTCGFMQLNINRCKELTQSLAAFRGQPFTWTPPSFE